MMHARDDYNRIQDPAGLIPEDEPVFLIRAQDEFGADAVLSWAFQAERHGGDRKLVLRARQQAMRMHAWPRHKKPDL
jgi:hypothetical protein